MLIDLRGLVSVGIGEIVELWGQNLLIQDVASDACTIPNDLFTRVSSRVSRLGR